MHFAPIERHIHIVSLKLDLKLLHQILIRTKRPTEIQCHTNFQKKGTKVPHSVTTRAGSG